MSTQLEHLEKELFNNSEEMRLYAIVDSAVDKTIDGHFESDDVERYILYRDEEDKRDLELRAPHLIPLEQKSIFIERLFKEGYGNSWGCFLKSREPIEVLVEHLSAYTKVYSEAHEQDVYIRFYDPRAINKYFTILEQEEAIAFFSKIETIYAEQVEEPQTLRKYSLNKDELIEREEINLEDEA